MTESRHQKVRSFYFGKNHGGQSVFDAWQNGTDIGSRIVPSIYSFEYRSAILRIMEEMMVFDKRKNILSIGSGIATIEKQLFDKGYANIVCTDIFPEFVNAEKARGLTSFCIDAFFIHNYFSNTDLIYMDGVLGHLASSYDPPFQGCLTKILNNLRGVLANTGIIVTSDDMPYATSDYEIHDAMPHLRLSNSAIDQELAIAKMVRQETHYIAYDRPSRGKVTRRILAIRAIY